MLWRTLLLVFVLLSLFGCHKTNTTYKNIGYDIAPVCLTKDIQLRECTEELGNTPKCKKSIINFKLGCAKVVLDQEKK